MKENIADIVGKVDAGVNKIDETRKKIDKNIEKMENLRGKRKQ